MAGDYTTAIKPARPKPDPLPHELEARIVMQYEGKTETILLKRRRTTFGRGDADVVTEDPTMSRKHFQIEVGRNGVVLHDLASANGTIYRGRWITFANLHDGDAFQAGNTRFQVSLRTTNLMPARLTALVVLEGDEGGSLARLLDNELFEAKSVEPGGAMEQCRAELPDLLVIEATARELTVVENLKRLPRLRHTTVVVLLAPENEFLRERCRMAQADFVLERPVAVEAIEEVAARLHERPQSRTLNFPASLRGDGAGDAHGRLVELSALGCRIRVTQPLDLASETKVTVRLLLPNEYGVVTARGTFQAFVGEEAEVRFDAFEGNGLVVVRRILRDAPMRFPSAG